MKFGQGQIIRNFVAKDGSKVVLRALKMSDLDQLLKFINTLVVEDTYILATKKKTRKGEKGWLRRNLNNMKKGRSVYVVALIGKKLIASSELKISTERSPHVGEIGIAILKGYRNIGIGKEMMKTLIEIGKKMKFKHLFLGVFGNNKVAINLYKKLGFEEVARLPKFFLHKGNYVDDILMMKKL